MRFAPINLILPLVFLAFTLPPEASASWLSKTVKKVRKEVVEEYKDLERDVKKQIKATDKFFDSIPELLEDELEVTLDVLKRKLKRELKDLPESSLNLVFSHFMPVDLAQLSSNMLLCGFHGKRSAKCRKEELKEYVNYLKEDAIQALIYSIVP